MPKRLWGILKRLAAQHRWVRGVINLLLHSTGRLGHQPLHGEVGFLEQARNNGRGRGAIRTPHDLERCGTAADPGQVQGGGSSGLRRRSAAGSHGGPPRDQRETPEDRLFCPSFLLDTWISMGKRIKLF